MDGTKQVLKASCFLITVASGPRCNVYFCIFTASKKVLKTKRFFNSGFLTHLTKVLLKLLGSDDWRFESKNQ